MLSLTESQELLTLIEKGSEARKAVEKFITERRMFFVQQMTGYLKQYDHEQATKYAHFDEAYEELLDHMADYATKQV